jgi:hypothetical protein
MTAILVSANVIAYVVGMWLFLDIRDAKKRQKDWNDLKNFRAK